MDEAGYCDEEAVWTEWPEDEASPEEVDESAEPEGDVDDDQV